MLLRGFVFSLALVLACDTGLLCAPVRLNDDSKTQSAKQQKSSDDGDVFTPGGDVKPPKVIHYVEPDFSPSSQEAYVEGVVRIGAVVDTEGIPVDLHVVKGLNAQEDRLAVEALKQWRFKPGTKNDKPVKVKINVEINFHLL